MQWGWWNQYGRNLWETIEKLEIPELVPLPKGTKRKESERVEASASQSKRGRVGAGGSRGNGSEAMPALNSVHQQATRVHRDAQPHVPNLPATRHLPSPVAAPATPANSNRNHRHPPQSITSTGHPSSMSGYSVHPGHNPAASYPSPMLTPHNAYPHYPHYRHNIPISHYRNQPSPPYPSTSPSPAQINPYPLFFHPDQSPFPLVSSPFPHSHSNPATSQIQQNDMTIHNSGDYSQESQFFEFSPGFGRRRQ